jgi:hypothetical protein
VKIHFENHFSDRLMEVTFDVDAIIESPEHFLELHRRWSDNILDWHTPYSCLVHLGGLSIAPPFEREFLRMLSLFRGFHMRKIVGVAAQFELTEENKATLQKCGFDAIASSREEALEVMGFRGRSGAPLDDGSVRRRIRIENFFEDRILEITFSAPTHLLTQDDVLELRTRIEYAIHQWHSEYHVMVDCSNLTVSPETFSEFEKLQSFLRAFFCKSFFGHSPKEGENYPFKTLAARHLALETIAKRSAADSKMDASAPTQTQGQKCRSQGLNSHPQNQHS